MSRLTVAQPVSWELGGTADRNRLAISSSNVACWISCRQRGKTIKLGISPTEQHAAGNNLKIVAKRCCADGWRYRPCRSAFARASAAVQPGFRITVITGLGRHLGAGFLIAVGWQRVKTEGAEKRTVPNAGRSPPARRSFRSRNLAKTHAADRHHRSSRRSCSIRTKD